MVQTRGMAAREAERERIQARLKYIPPSGKCLLLALPAELRIRIYEFVVCKEHSVGIYRLGIPPFYRPDALIYTCRLVYDEAVATYLRVNTFTFYFLHVPADSSIEKATMHFGWLSKHIKAMQHIRICCRMDHKFLINFNARKTEYTLQLKSDQFRLRSSVSPAVGQHQAAARQFLDDLIAQAREQGRTLALEKEHLGAIAMILMGPD